MKRILLCMAAIGVLQVEAQVKQVWDFGAEQFATSEYENMLSEAEINSWYGEQTAAGTSGVNLPAFTAHDSVNLRYNTNGASNHRLRTLNTNVTRYDEKSLKDGEGNVYRGYIYSNSGKQPLVYIEQRYEAGDKVEFYAGSNGSRETYRLESPSGAMQTAEYTASAKIEKLTFYIGEDGLHRFCGVDEKLVLARIVRTPAKKGILTGDIITPEALPASYGIIFRNTQTNSIYQAEITGNTYRAELPTGYTYEAGLTNANGFVVSNGTTILFEEDGQKKDLQIEKVETCNITGGITGLPVHELNKLTFETEKPIDKVFEPIITIDYERGKYSAEVEKGVQYNLKAQGVNDYRLTTTELASTEDREFTLVFEKKPTWGITIHATLQGEEEQQTTLSETDLQGVQFVFNNLKEEGYEYIFTGTKDIALRDGTYSIECRNVPNTMHQMLTSNLRIDGQETTKQIDFERNIAVETVLYRSILHVGKEQEFKTIGSALEEARRMDRTSHERVEILIEPGNYEEMLFVDIPSITLRNSSNTPSIELRNGGVDIAENAVRITGYYGWGYDYFSMDKDGFYNKRVLQVNKENGYASTANPAQGNTLWNATVVVSASDFIAEGIIFENSFNQYISTREADDVLTETSASKGIRPTQAGNTDVQKRTYRERACAIGFKKTADRAHLIGCRVISRQDALYGDEGCRVAIEDGILNGSCDYIFGGMTLVAKGTRLDMLVSSDPNDIAYLTASKTSKEGRGYLFYECSIGSATPEQDMVETMTAQPGYLGRPWDANGETVFCNTYIGKSRTGESLIVPAGWNNGLVSGGSNRSYEYGTIEETGIDNTGKRVSWAVVLQEPVLPDGTEISLYNFTKGDDGWDPFKDNKTSVQKVSDMPFLLYSTANGMLQIGQVEEDTMVQIYSIDGRELYSQTMHKGSAKQWEMPQGIYIVKTGSKYGEFSQKVSL